MRQRSVAIDITELISELVKEKCYNLISRGVRREVFALHKLLLEVKVRGASHPRFAWAAALKVTSAGLMPPASTVSAISDMGLSVISILTKVRADTDYAWLNAPVKTKIEKVLALFAKAIKTGDYKGVRCWVEDIEVPPVLHRISDMAMYADPSVIEPAESLYHQMTEEMLSKELSRLRTNQYADEIMKNESGALFYKSRAAFVSGLLQARGRTPLVV